MTAPCPIFGFLVEIEIGENTASADSESLWNAFMAFVEQRGLDADGGRGRRFWTYRLHGESTQASNLDRTAVQDWAAARAEIVAVRVGELFDLQSAA